MKIAIVAPSAVPFMIGGAERLWHGLLEHLNRETPHDAELIKLPSREHNLPDLMATYRSFADVDLTHFDLVISGKYPAWMVSHPNHVVYMLHPLRGLYDTYQHSEAPPGSSEAQALIEGLAGYVRANPPAQAAGPDRLFALFEHALGQLGPDHPAFRFPGPLARQLVHWLDGYALTPRRVRAHFAISRTVAERSGYFPAAVPVTVAVPPSSLQGLGPGGAHHFFTASRLDQPKRLDLVIEAMRYVTADIPLRIAGTGPDEARLRALAKGDDRVRFEGRITDAELAGLYRDSVGVLFVPADEDLGLVTLEAQHCAKPVITCTDSGGPTELVVDDGSGFVVAPNPASIGAAMQRLVSDPARAKALGEAGRVAAEDVTWAAVADKLLVPAGPATSSAVAASGRMRVVVVCTFPLDPARGGGQIRASRLFSALAREVDVDFVCLGGGAASDRMVVPGLRQRVICRSEQHQRMEWALADGSATPVTDITDAVLWAETPAFVAALADACRGAEAVVLEHPYLLPAVRHVAPDLPFIYDAQNAESAMKDDYLDRTPAGDRLRRVVWAVERQAVRSAELVVACSERDVVLLKDLGPTLASFRVVANGADIRSTPFVDLGARAARRSAWVAELSACAGPRLGRLALFMGSDHPPNSAAGEAICAFAPELPDVLFILAGGHADRLMGRRVPSNVLLEGLVTDARRLELLGMVDVALNPMTLGGGTNLKLIEYFAAGIPTVSTPLGARGTGAADGVELLLAELADFPAAIRATLDGTEATARRVRAAHALACRDFDWDDLGAQFAACVIESINARISRSPS